MLQAESTSVPVTLPQARHELRRAIGATCLAHWKVAALAELSATQLSHILSGRRDVTPHEAARLAIVVGKPVVEILPEIDETAEMP